MSTVEVREWAPLFDLFTKLPQRVQNGLFSFEIKITCMDIVPEFIAIGTNFGLVYWYDRHKKSLEKLRCENSHTPITSVKIISTVEYMVACGDLKGHINIFQIPKSLPDNLPDSFKVKNKQIERYTVSDLHNVTITALEWSKNGMKLFSGDKNGHVILTELDFYMHLCKSVEILNESYEIVQLSYVQPLLLISTTFRSIVCKKEDKWRVSQIGRKDRKTLGNFGGTFVQNSLKPKDVIIYCTRPGLRLWISDIQGNVEQTLLFKDVISQPCHEVCLLNPISAKLKSLKPQKEPMFGPLLVFKDNLLVTYNNDVVYIINPKQLAVCATISNLRRVLHVSVCKNEIFILEGDRSLVRISDLPENLPNTPIPTPLTSTLQPIASSIKDLKQRIQSSSFIAAIPSLGEISASAPTIHMDSEAVAHAEEATESPERNSPSSSQHDMTKSQSNEKLQLYNRIAMQEFDDTILYKQKKRKKSDMCTSTASWSSTSSDERETTNIARPTLMNVSAVSGVLPDLRSPQTISNDIESKEKMLADVLCLDRVKFSLEELEKCNTMKERIKLNEEPIRIFSDFNFDNNIVETIESKPLEQVPIVTRQRNELPVCANIPNDWELKEVQLNEPPPRFDSNSFNLSSEWEII